MIPVQLTVLTADDTVVVTAFAEDDRFLLEPDAVRAATGWEPKTEGLCRGDVCVPVRDPAARDSAGRYDLARVAAALHRPFAAERTDVTSDTPSSEPSDPTAVASIGEAAHERAAALRGGHAPRLELTGLDGSVVAVPGGERRKRVVLAWSSW